jgi:rhodanese-related sulfurtransferase
LFCTNKTKAEEVSFDELQTLLKSKKIQLIDVREPQELVEDGKIPHHINIPLAHVVHALSLSDDKFRAKFGVKKPAESDTDIVFYCRSGNRSLAAVEMAKKAGFKHSRHYKGGCLEYNEKMGIGNKK